MALKEVGQTQVWQNSLLSMFTLGFLFLCFFFLSGAHLCCKFPILPHPKGVLLDSDPMTENDPEEHLKRA